MVNAEISSYAKISYNDRWVFFSDAIIMSTVRDCVPKHGTQYVDPFFLFSLICSLCLWFCYFNVSVPAKIVELYLDLRAAAEEHVRVRIYSFKFINYYVNLFYVMFFFFFLAFKNLFFAGFYWTLIRDASSRFASTRTACIHIGSRP